MIDSFRGSYRFLSNFFPCSVTALWGELTGIPFPQTRLVQSVEHAYQAAKAINPTDFDIICEASSPVEAKRLGKKLRKLPDNWESRRLYVMERLLKEKFSDFNPHLKKMLIDTNNELLIEGNNWRDTFWGVYNGEGENHLGRLLMQIRESMR